MASPFYTQNLRVFRPQNNEVNMKTITATKWIAALVVAAGLTVSAQENGEKGGGQQGGGQGGQHPRPNPEQLAKKLMEKFDANKDTELDAGELTAALKDMREHRQQAGGQGGQGGNAQGGPKGGRHGGQQGGDQGGAAVGNHPTPPPADEIAAKMMEKFSSDKKGLTEAELAKALAAHRPGRGQHEGGPNGGGHKSEAGQQ